MDKWILNEKELKWYKMFGLAKKFFEKYGNLEIPATFKTSDGITYDPNGVNLGMWLVKQRQRCNPESIRGKLLSSIGMRFESIKRKSISFEDGLTMVQAYIKEYGDSNIPYDFKTKDGVIPDEDGICLGAWLYRKKRKYRPDSEEGKLLLSIGVEFDDIKFVDKDTEWMEMYLVAAKYYKEHGNLNVPVGFITDDGLCLGKWIVNQRNYYRKNKLSEEKIILLNSIGMIWEKGKNTLNITVMCDQYNIDIEKNKFILKNKSFTEFKVKLSYLKDNHINIVDENGMLNEIFSMSSMNMKLKYGVSLEDLVNMYNKGKSK